MTSYELLEGANVYYLNDILRLIAHTRGWNGTVEEIADKVEYSYGSGTSGLIEALYNTTLALMEEE